MVMETNWGKTRGEHVDSQRLDREPHPYKRVEHIGDATLYLGDAFQIMPTLGQVDHVITDPPFSDNTHKKAMTNKGPKEEGYNKDLHDGKYVQGGAKLIDFESMDDKEFHYFVRNSLNISNRWIVMTCDHKHAYSLLEWPEFIRLGVWVKIAPMPQISGDRPANGYESIAILHNEGGRRWNKGGHPAIWQHQPMKRKTAMPTQKPIKLLNDFVADFTDKDELILDPFMGSGTTGVAALSQGRKFIGIEKREDIFINTCERIDQAQRQGRLFE